MILPFRGLRPAPGRAAEIIAPPYDVMSRAEAVRLATGRPWSFLHISRPEIDLPAETGPYDDAVYLKAAENLKKMIAEGLLRRDDNPCYYVYRLIWEDHENTGLVASASIADYNTNRIRKHEHTQPKKEDDRVRQIDAVNAQTGPVMMAYPQALEIDALLGKAASGAPAVDVTASNGVKHMLWVVDESDGIAAIGKAFEELDAIYIADGHHRSAAAARVCAKRDETAEEGDDAAWRGFLSVIFPHHQMKILDYNRVITDLRDHEPQALLAQIARRFSVDPSDVPVRPGGPGEFGCYMDRQWYRLLINEKLIPDDPVGRLDVQLLADNLISPLLGIEDQRRDPRIDFVGGIRGLAELEQRVDSGDAAIAFSFYPTGMEDIMYVADAGKVMPTKSTWFEPKLADGMVSLVLE